MIKTTVAVNIMRLGGRDWHEEEKDYRKGDLLEMPDVETAKGFGTSVKITQEPKQVKPIEIEEKEDSKTPKKKKRETTR
jgi:hypothetical protein